MSSIQERIAEDVHSNDVLLFMKGTPVFPQCGFSAAVVQILSDLGVHSMRMLTNNPRKRHGMETNGMSVSELVPIEIPASEFTRRYLQTKKEKLGHLLSSV